MTRRRLYTERVRVDISVPMKQALEDVCRETGIHESEYLRSLILQDLRVRGRALAPAPAVKRARA